MKWIDAIVYTLQNNRTENGEYEPMHYSDITEAIIENNLRNKFGITPQNTVNATLSTHPELFIKMVLGMYGLTDKGKKYIVKGVPTAIIEPTETPETIETQEDTDSDAPEESDPKIAEEIENENKSKIVKIFGMFWDRSKVNWSANNMLGQQIGKSDPVDFSEVRGIYLLHDGREVIYVGQAHDTSIYKRLRGHTKDRHSGRWNRFSWFGLDGIDSETGKIIKTSEDINVNLGDLINSLEGILIEGLEPRQNRKQGNKFGDEYIQVSDPSMEKDKAQKYILEMFSKS